jgi:hypothetical protein
MRWSAKRERNKGLGFALTETIDFKAKKWEKWRRSKESKSGSGKNGM